MNNNMMTANPFRDDTERAALWDIVVRSELESMLQGNFDIMGQHCVAETFWYMDAAGTMLTDAWRIKLVGLAAYRPYWEQNVGMFMKMVDAEAARLSFYNSSILRDIEIVGRHAVARLKFYGNIPMKDGKPMHIEWQALYHLDKLAGKWKIAGIVHHLPFKVREGGGDEKKGSSWQKMVPKGVAKPPTAGPYSPVLTVRGKELIVISGQVPVDAAGKVVGSTIAEQTEQVLANARDKLHLAGVNFSHVFKVHVYLTDLANWSSFNEIYKRTMPEPLPARTAIASGLLKDFLVEVDMWAIN